MKFQRNNCVQLEYFVDFVVVARKMLNNDPSVAKCCSVFSRERSAWSWNFDDVGNSVELVMNRVSANIGNERPGSYFLPKNGRHHRKDKTTGPELLFCDQVLKVLCVFRFSYSCTLIRFTLFILILLVHFWYVSFSWFDHISFASFL